jgi:hypothetical protein
VWRDDVVTTTTCPVLAFTDEVEELTTWFAACYDLDVDSMSGRAVWRRKALPAAGGVGDQDARLFHGLEYLCSVQNEIVVEEHKRATVAKKQKKRRDG